MFSWMETSGVMYTTHVGKCPDRQPVPSRNHGQRTGCGQWAPSEPIRLLSNHSISTAPPEQGGALFSPPPRRGAPGYRPSSPALERDAPILSLFLFGLFLPLSPPTPTLPAFLLLPWLPFSSVLWVGTRAVTRLRQLCLCPLINAPFRLGSDWLDLSF